MYRRTGNILLSSLMGADLYLDETPRPIEDQGPLVGFVEQLREPATSRTSSLAAHPSTTWELRLPTVRGGDRPAEPGIRRSVPAPDSLHRKQQHPGRAPGRLRFHGEPISVIGVADDHETEIKRARVLELANNTLAEIGAAVRVPAADVEIISADRSEYGEAEPETIDIIRRFSRAEGIVADPVYEGKALRGLEKLIGDGYFDPTAKVLILHLGGTPAVHAYATNSARPRSNRYPTTYPANDDDRAVKCARHAVESVPCCTSPALAVETVKRPSWTIGRSRSDSNVGRS